VRVAFLGTPPFAVPSLEGVQRAGHVLAVVLTQPARPVGRGLRPNPSAVYLAATRLGLPVVEAPASRRDIVAEALLRAEPEVTVVVGWGGLLDRRCREAARLATINLHASLLPQYRGAAPIERAIMAGETETGVTVMDVAPELDAGDIILQCAVPIPSNCNAEYLRTKLSMAGAQLLCTALCQIALGTAARLPQARERASYAPKLGPEDERISWRMAATEIVNRVRAMSPSPGAYFVFRGRRVKVIVAHGNASPAVAAAAAARAGTVVGRRGEALEVIAGGGTRLVVERVKPAGGREMSGADLANGWRLVPGSALEDEEEGSSGVGGLA
jgi:methionyl-tRNA formyltransferase